MATSRIEMRVRGHEELRDLSADLKAAGRTDLRRELLKELRRAGRPVVADVRRAVLATPSRGARGGPTSHQGGRGLRAAIAKATGMSISTGGSAAIRIRVSAKQIEPATLPKYLDGELGAFSRWRHPVFGNADVWTQQSSHPYFFTTIRGHRDDLRRACLEAMDTIADKLAGGG